MATIPVLDYIANVVEDTYVNLKTAVGIITKNLQEFVDSVAQDPDADNSNVAFDISRQLYSPFYFNVYTREVTTDYNNWDKGSGQQPCLCYGIIEINNETVSIHDMQLLGRVPNGDRWDWLTPTEIDDVKNLISNALSGLNPIFTPDNPVYYRYSSYLNGYIVKTTDNSNITFDDELPEKTIDKSSVPFDIVTMNIVYDEDTDYWTDIQMSYGGFKCTVKQPLVVVTTQESFATDYVVNNGATNNYVDTFLTLGGNLKVYYGDNYIIYVVPSGVKVTYDIMFNVTKQVTQVINGDNPSMPQIVVPTYNENKYGPEPEPSDYTDDNFGLTTTGFSSNIGGAGNYWLMDLTTIAGFISDFKTTAPAGSMISQNILSCYVNALNYEWETGKDNIVIHAAGAQNTPYTSTSQYDYIYQYNPHVVVGQYKVPRVTETFYDFNPYSTYELYIPFCGWIGLPDTVAGRNIRVYMDFDVATMSCKAYVMVEMEDGSGDTICGEIIGSFGAPCPVQVIEGGLYKQAMINSGLQIASGVVSGLMGGAFGGPVGVSMLATGGMNAVQGLASAYMAGNTNYGQTIGRAGDTSGLCGGHYCYIKITHPVIDEVVDTETFGHTTGYPCYMESELTDLVGTGFTVCLNPHVHVNCTQSEKEEIKRLLESGVIL